MKIAQGSYMKISSIFYFIPRLIFSKNNNDSEIIIWVILVIYLIIFFIYPPFNLKIKSHIVTNIIVIKKFCYCNYKKRSVNIRNRNIIKLIRNHDSWDDINMRWN